MTEETKPVSRSCSNCACSMIQEHPANPMEKQTFCRKNPPLFQQLRMEVPRKDKAGNIITGRDNKPIMENEIVGAFLYMPTNPDMVCFDGWRPMGTLPGEKSVFSVSTVDSMVDAVSTAFKQLQSDLQKDYLASLATNELSS
jgi:hypothetical protein